jgi:hypothetical protein
MGAVYQVIYSGAEEPPAQSEIDAWITTFGLYNSVLVPEASAPEEVLDALDRRECAFIVETGCMQIQWKLCSCGELGCDSTADVGLDELTTALGG